MYKNTNLSKQRKAERDYYHKQFEIHNNDLGNSWKIIKEMIGKVDHHKVKKHTTFIINNQYSSDSKIIANHFNEYLIKVGSSLANNIKSHTDPLRFAQKNKNTINIQEISVNEIQSVISSLSNSAAGADEIPASIMKQLVNYYVEPLTHMINQSILQGYFPEELKLAKVLLKMNNWYKITDQYQFYHFFSKVFEKIMSNYIIEFMEENKLFYKNQFGPTLHQPCNHHINRKVSKALDSGKIVEYF